MKTKPTVWLMALCIFAAGCGASNTAESGSGDEQASDNNPSSVAEASPAQEKPELLIKNWEETQQLIAENKGKVVVLDLWSSWWVECIREFPGLVQLHKKHKDKVVCMSLNLDYSGDPSEPPESFRKSVYEFLTERDANFQNIISSVPDAEIYDKLGVASIPAVLVYDREGQLAKRFTNDVGEFGEEGFSYEKHIVPFVEGLLQPAAGP